MHGDIITNVGIEQCETFSEVICNERNKKKQTYFVTKYHETWQHLETRYLLRTQHSSTVWPCSKSGIGSWQRLVRPLSNTLEDHSHSPKYAEIGAGHTLFHTYLYQAGHDLKLARNRENNRSAATCCMIFHDFLNKCLQAFCHVFVTFMVSHVLGHSWFWWRLVLIVLILFIN